MRFFIPLSPLFVVLALACGGGGEEGPTPTPVVAVTPTAEAPAGTLAFLRDGDVLLVNADGTGERRLGLGNVRSFSWVSADELDVVTGEDQSGHLLVNLEGKAQQLPFPAGGSWSRDGTRYVVPVDEQVVVFNRDGSEAVRLDVEPPVIEGPKPQACGTRLFDSGQPDSLLSSRPAFSPDHQQIVIAVNCRSRMSAAGGLLAPVVLVPLDGSGQRALGELQANVGRGADVRFSPSGAQVAVIDSSHGNACSGMFNLRIAGIDGTNVTAIALAAVNAAFDAPDAGLPRGGVVGYDWSPDGDAVVASVNISMCPHFDVDPAGQQREVEKGLYVIGLDGSEEELVDGPTVSPAWSPSGGYVAFVSQEYFGMEIGLPLLRVIDMMTRAVVDLGQGEQPAWQPAP